MNNYCKFRGRLTKDPELRYLDSGTAVCNFSIAVNEDYTRKDGKTVEKTVYPEFVAWGDLGEYVNQKFKKGTMVDVLSSFNEEKWVDKEGQKRRFTRFKTTKIDFTYQGDDDSVRATVKEDGVVERQENRPDSQEEGDDNIPF